jgi:hypothetical protein
MSRDKVGSGIATVQVMWPDGIDENIYNEISTGLVYLNQRFPPLV